MGTVLRQVYVTRYPRPSQSFVDSGNVQNLLGTTLKPVPPSVASPLGIYAQTDWQNPIRSRTAPIGNLTHIFYYVSDTNGPPSYNYDLSNPITRRTIPVGNLSHISFFLLDTNGPVAYNYDFPNPQGVQPRNINRGFEGPSSLALLSGPPPPPPFYGFTFENPLQPAWRKDLRHHLSFTTPPSQIILPPQPIFGLTFPNPTLRKPYYQRDETTSIIATGLLHPLPPPTYFGGGGMTLRGT